MNSILSYLGAAVIHSTSHVSSAGVLGHAAKFLFGLRGDGLVGQPGQDLSVRRTGEVREPLHHQLGRDVPEEMGMEIPGEWIRQRKTEKLQGVMRPTKRMFSKYVDCVLSTRKLYINISCIT